MHHELLLTDVKEILLVDGPLDGTTGVVDPETDGPFRFDVAGKGTAKYQQIAHLSDGTARARFIGYEDCDSDS